MYYLHGENCCTLHHLQPSATKFTISHPKKGGLMGKSMSKAAIITHFANRFNMKKKVAAEMFEEIS